MSLDGQKYLVRVVWRVLWKLIARVFAVQLAIYRCHCSENNVLPRNLASMPNKSPQKSQDCEDSDGHERNGKYRWQRNLITAVVVPARKISVIDVVPVRFESNCGLQVTRDAVGKVESVAVASRRESVCPGSRTIVVWDRNPLVIAL